MRLRIIMHTVILILILITATSCTKPSSVPAPVKLYWKTWLEEGYTTGGLCDFYPVTYLYNPTEETLYIRGSYEGFAAIDIQNKKILWKKFGYFNDGRAPLYEYDGLIYTYIFNEKIWKIWYNGEVYIVGIDKKTGEIKWKYMLEANDISVGFTLKDKYIYAMDWDPEATSVSTEGILKKIDIETKEVVWEVRGLKPLKSVKPVIDDESGLVFVGSLGVVAGNPVFYAFDKETGKLKWKKIFENEPWGIFTTPIVHGEFVYVVTDTGRFYKFKKDTGELIWHTVFEEECPEYKGDAIHFEENTYIYKGKYLITVETDEIGAVAVDTETGKIVWIHPGYGALEGIYLDEKEGKIYAHGWGDVLECVDAETGKRLWKYSYENGCMRLAGAPYKVGKYIIDGDTSNYLYVLEEYE